MPSAPAERNRSGRGANRASRLGRIFDATADACAVEETYLGALVEAIERQAPRHRLRLDDVRVAFASFYYGGPADESEARRAEKHVNGLAAHETAKLLREAADFYRGGN